MSAIYKDKDGMMRISAPDENIERMMDRQFVRTLGKLEWSDPNWKGLQVAVSANNCGGCASGVEYDSDSHTLWIARADKELEAKLDEKYERVQGYLRWKLGTESWVGKAKDALTAVISGHLTDDDPIVRLRHKQCFGDSTKPKCSALSIEADGSWCKACSCGNTKIANMDGSQSKLTFRTLKCPRMMPGFSNAQS